MAEITGHPIQVVARRTGLTADTIRVWERRYGAVRPKRAANNRRLYTDADVERLGLLRRAIAGGRRIGDVAGLEHEALRQLVEQDQREAARYREQGREAAAGESPRDALQACLSAVEALDSAGLEHALTGAANRLGVHPLIHEVLSPLMQTVGERWASGELTVAHEHLTSAMVRGLLGALRTGHAHVGAGPGIVVATPAGQTHELGALMAAVTASAEGWRVAYLGPDLPAEEIVRSVADTGARALAISAIYPNSDAAFLDELRRIAELLPVGVEMFVGGGALTGQERACRAMGARYLPDYERFTQALRQLRDRTR